MSTTAASYLALGTSTPPLPRIPTRDEVCSVRITFQGFTVETAQFGTLPWFEAALTSLTPADRQRVYAAKHAAGDTHCIVALTWRYAEPGQPYFDIPGCDMTGDLPRFRAMVDEVIRAGFIPMLFLGGDGQEFSEIGWTYGAMWLLTNLTDIVTAVAELAPYCLWVPGWDGVFYGWSVGQIQALGWLFRKLLPVGHLGIEHDTGHIPVGNGPSDYAPGGAMTDYDVILSEYDLPLGTDSTWQVTARLVSPYHRPSDQPVWDDPNPPFYLATPTTRGPYYHCAFEWSEYYWVRSQLSAADVNDGRTYLRGLGCRWTG